MNSTGDNTILFSKHKANYTFTLTVVDPRSSYCHLSTKFAVSWLFLGYSAMTIWHHKTTILSFISLPNNRNRPSQVNNQSRDWLSANQGPVFSDSIGSCLQYLSHPQVWVEDAPNSSNLGLIVLVAACVITLVILFVLYFRYKKKILDKANMVLANG